ncbi:MAG: hypothetical protein HQL98_00535 [Magnetococcales bacterium]|nr:hypothetical protein [Magnetococcales bacterium]
MNRILPGLALLLLLGGAGLGVAMATLDDLLTQLQRLWIQVGVTNPDPDLTGTLDRLQGALNLVILALGSGCGVLGAGLWMRRSTLRDQADWQSRLTRMLADTHETRQTEIARLETLLTAQTETSKEMTVALTTQTEIFKEMAATLANQTKASQEMAAELATLKESALRAETLANTPPLPPVHAPPTNLLAPLTPIASPFASQHYTMTPPHHARRLAIGGPEAPHDKQDEEFEPF